MFSSVLAVGQVCEDGAAPVSLTLDLTGEPTAGVQGAAANGTGSLDFGSLHTIVGVEWTGVDIEPIGGSWCSEPVLRLGTGLFLTFGIGEDNTGPCNNGYSSGGFLNLELLGIPPYQTDGSGILAWEAFEAFDDNDGATVDQVYGSGIVTVWACSGLVTLPIDLVSFTGKSLGSKNLIEWTTATEVNSEKHIIEYSKDGRSQWQTVGSVDAKGNSSKEQKYSLTHDKPTSTSYYRLREVSLDGDVHYSDVIKVNSEIKGFSVTSLFPNPTTDRLSVQVESEADSEVLLLSVTDINGRVCHTSTYTTFGQESKIDVALEDLPAGVYTLNIRSNSSSENRKFVKQ